MTPSQYWALCALVALVPSIEHRWRMLLASVYVTLTIAQTTGLL